MKGPICPRSKVSLSLQLRQQNHIVINARKKQIDQDLNNNHSGRYIAAKLYISKGSVVNIFKKLNFRLKKKEKIHLTKEAYVVKRLRYSHKIGVVWTKLKNKTLINQLCNKEHRQYQIKTAGNQKVTKKFMVNVQFIDFFFRRIRLHIKNHKCLHNSSSVFKILKPRFGLDLRLVTFKQLWFKK
ncbi:hypothetical protein BpHYR1_047817 [Brachionus plicatilis]|uniref:Uncharacterized protein n=1 Tax=Brachionus plicatilis TaxID=10195 RepID=A0A3M7RT03_BRAPC|nr:hypothetical protein BpHYR1_047817 [Brachionus plicatilis]